jgi:hypothetical protein
MRRLVATRAPVNDPWTHARRIERQLGAWAALSLVAAGVLTWAALAWPEPLSVTLGAVALQFAVWGAIDGAIAAFGARDRRRRLARGDAADAKATAAFGSRLRRLLRLNAGLDVGSLAVGLALVLLWRTPAGAGHGLGVLVQGGFLLLFDAWHGWRPVGYAGEPGRPHPTRTG